MALKNFIKEGTYLTFERIDYSKLNKHLAANIIVYADDTKQEIVLQTSLNVCSNVIATPIVDVITSEDALMDEAPEYLSLDPDESILIEIDNPECEYAKYINGFVMSRNSDGGLSVMCPLYLEDKNHDIYERDDLTKKFVKMDKYIIKTSQQFDRAIDSSNIVKSFYEILKRMPLYKDCIDA